RTRKKWVRRHRGKRLMSTGRLQASHPAYRDSSEPEWLAGLRQEALDAFNQVGFPGPRTEAWKYSNPKHIASVDWALGASSVLDIDGLRLSHADIELVFVNGHFSEKLSRGEAARTYTLQEAIRSGAAQGELAQFTSESSEPFSALNLAFVQDGAWIQIEGEEDHPGVIHILHVVNGEADNAAQIRNRIQLGRHASVEVVESYVGLSAGSLTNAVTEVDLHDGSELVHCLWQRGPSGTKIGRVHIQQRRDSAYDGHSFWLGGGWVRNDIEVELKEAGAACSLNGLYLLDGNQHLDNHTLIDHQAPHCVSRELYKGVLSGKSTGVYNGMVKVQQIAQKTDSEQANHNLLLSDTADINTKPELEIYADDVKCAHGTTVGQLDAEALMYMRMRGIPKAEAVHMLTQAFADELLGELEDEDLQEVMAEQVTARLVQLKDGH
ncbi:MAG: Fe-S cluster assembly protein SufD, partial [Myxococcota bacterium]|nr:Fe-S cluster assembly protein SufD [Myxococcota bacterium]